MIAQESMEPPQSGQTTSPEQARNSSSSSPSSRLNAGAPEFVPRSTPRLVMQPSFNGPLFHASNQTTFGGNFGKQLQPQPADPDQVPAPTRNNNGGGGGLSEEARNKILNQVEYYFSDVNLATTDHLMKFISKDPDGYVPISVVASFKKIKAFVSSPHQLATLLRKSSKLVVSDDGKKVKRQSPLTEPDMEELQSRIILAENLPEDHSYQNLMRVFSCVGSVKTIRTCQPQNANVGPSAPARSKLENTFLSNKLHAFVEYESADIAEKAVSELNDERNWRSGLKVRLMPKRMSNKGRGSRKFGEEEDDLSTSSEQLQENHSPQTTCSTASDMATFPQDHHTSTASVDDKEVVSAKQQRGGGRGGRGNGNGKGRGRSQHGRASHNNVIGTTPPGSLNEHSLPNAVSKQPPGPRMPDGTRGFALGRGKPLL